MPGRRFGLDVKGGEKMTASLRKMWSMFAKEPGFALLAASDRRLAGLEGKSFSFAWLSVMAYSLLMSLAIVGVWGAVWPVFDMFSTIDIPVIAVVAFMLLLPYRNAAISLADLLGGRNRTARSICAAIIVAVMLTSFSLITRSFYHNETILPESAAWLRPDFEIYRVLLLMPLWGGWSMLVVCQFCKARERTEPAVAAFAKNCGPLATAGCMGATMAATIFYFNFLPMVSQLIMVGGTVAAAVIGGILTCALAGGLRRKSLLATNMFTQIAFVFIYLANR